MSTEIRSSGSTFSSTSPFCSLLTLGRKLASGSTQSPILLLGRSCRDRDVLNGIMRSGSYSKHLCSVPPGRFGNARKMFHSKRFAAPSGRKQRIEGIVQNLSAKITLNNGGALLNGGEIEEAEMGRPVSATSFPAWQRRVEPVWTTTSTPIILPTRSAYHLPRGLEFSGVVSSLPLSKGTRFGPYYGKITPGTDDIFMMDHIFACQIPDLDGNPNNLYLLTGSLGSCMWLKCLQRCSLQGVHNMVAYNTPRGVVLEMVAETTHGAELCVAYDQSYDITETSPVAAAEVFEVPSCETIPERRIELHANVEVPDEQPCSPGGQASTIGDVFGYNTKADAHVTEPELPYSVMTAEVTGHYDSAARRDRKKYLVSKERRSTGSSLNLTKIKEEKPYKCHSCKSRFETLEEKQHHLETKHTRECPVCKKSYSKTYLKEHMLFHLESSRLTCPMCSRVFSSMSNLRKHQKKHAKRSCAVIKPKTEPGTVQCSECPQTFKSEKQLEVHRRKHVRVVPISCSECHLTFSHKNLLRKHQAVVHSGKKPYSCKICQKTFTQSGNLARHCRQLHSASKVVTPEVVKDRYLCRRRGCDQKSFASREVFIKHLQQHSGGSGSGVFPCKLCNGVFSSASNLCKHTKTQHKDKDKKSPPPAPSGPVAAVTSFPCRECKETFQSEYAYNRHVRSHHKPTRENRCEGCSKSFATRSGLAKHIRLRRCSAVKERKPVVKPQKTYNCTTCDQHFFTISELKVHRRLHFTENQHPCDVCGKSFSQRGNLGKHKRHVHLGIPRPRDKPRGDRKPSCDTCEVSFASTPELEEHRKTHDIDKPCKCAYCDRRFSNMGGRKKHMMSCSMGEDPASMLSIRTSSESGADDHVTMIKTEHSPHMSSMFQENEGPLFNMNERLRHISMSVIGGPPQASGDNTTIPVNTAQAPLVADDDDDDGSISEQSPVQVWTALPTDIQTDPGLEFIENRAEVSVPQNLLSNGVF